MPVTSTIRPLVKPVTMRMFGQNLTMSVGHWLDLADELRDDSESRARILANLNPEPQGV